MRIADRLLEERGKAQAFARAADPSRIPPTTPKEHRETMRMHNLVIKTNPDMALVWIEAPMVQLLLHAQQSLEPFPFHADLLPWPGAMCVTENPLDTNIDENGALRQITHCLWGMSDEKDAVCVSFAESHAGYVMPVQVAIQAEGKPWRDEPHARTICALWLLLQQRIAVAQNEEPSRAARRRVEREGLNIPLVTTIRLRRPESRSGNDVGEAPEWSHRWMVDGHWRNQYLPSTGQHRPTWIAPYVKGPDDKPLVMKEKVYVWGR